MNKYFSAFYQPVAEFFVLRWTVVGLMLLHGISKLLHGALIGEVVGPLLVPANIMVASAALAVICPG